MDALSFGTFERSLFDQARSKTFFLAKSGESANQMSNGSANSFFADYWVPEDINSTSHDIVKSSSSLSESQSQQYVSFFNDSSDSSSTIFGDALLRINHSYRLVHGELSLAVCVFGIVANVLNIIVLSRYKESKVYNHISYKSIFLFPGKT